MIKKIILYAFGVILLSIMASLLIARLYKKEIKQAVIKIANDNLSAKFNFEDASLNFITGFPRMTVNVEGIKIVGKNEFEKDTLANIENLKLEINLYSYLFNDKIEIEKIILKKAKCNLIVLQNGKENWNILITDTTAKKEKPKKVFELVLKHYKIIESDISYNDHMRSFLTIMTNINHEGSGDFSKEVFSLKTATSVEQLSLKYLGNTYLSEVAAKLEAPIQMDFSKMQFSFKNNDLLLNELPIHFDAWIAMPDSNIDMDIKFNAEKSPLKDFLSLIPVLYKNSFKDLTASGKLTLNGYMKGIMTDAANPAFGLAILVEQGAFKYANLPVGVKGISMNFKLDNSDGILDHTVIGLNDLKMSLNNKPFNANLIIKNPESNPYVKGYMNGIVDLSDIKKLIPELKMQINGIIKANIQLDGTVNEFKKGKGQAKGDFTLTNMVYKNEKDGNDIKIPSATFLVTSKKLLVSSFIANVNSSDFNITGGLENYLLYFLKNEPLVGNLDLQSKMIDLNELMHLTTTSKDTSISDFSLPNNIKFDFNAAIEKIKYKDWTLTNAAGGLSFLDQKVIVNKLKFNLLDAAFNATGFYSKKDKETPKMDINFDIQHLNINTAYRNFTIIQKYLPIIESAKGEINTNVKFSSDLSNGFAPQMNTVNSEGDIYLNNVNISGSETLNKIASLVKFEQLKNLEIKPAHLSYTISKGRFIVKPFDITTNFTKLNIKGSNGIDKSLDYQVEMDLPKQATSNGLSEAVNKELAKVNPNFNIDKFTKALRVLILINGNITSPQINLRIKTNIGGSEGIAETAINQAKEAVTVEIKKQVNTKIEDAQRQADVIINEAQAFSERIRQEAYAKADKIVEEAKNPFAQIGAKLIADKIKKEADKKSAQIIADAKAKADSILINAKQ